MANTNSVYNLKKVDLDTFNDFALSFQAPKSMWNAIFMQSKAMAKIYEDKKYDVHPLVLYDDKEPIAGGLFCVMPAMKFFRVARCFHGPLVDISNYELLKSFTEALVEYFKREKVISIQIQPDSLIVDENISNLKACGYKHEGFYEGYRNGIGRFHFLKDFSDIDNEEKLWASYQSKTRNHIKNAIKIGVKCKEAKPNEIDIFYKILESTGSRRDFEYQGKEYFDRLIDVFKESPEMRDPGTPIQDAMIVLAYIEPDESIKLLQQEIDVKTSIKTELENSLNSDANVKKINNKIKATESEIEALHKKISMINDLSDGEKRIYISAATFVTFNNEMVYLFSGSYAKYYGLSGSQLMQHYAQTKAMEYGLKKYSYFITDGKHAGGDDDGVLNFKKGFGGYLEELPGEFHININKFWGKILEMRNGF